ncbi:MAG: hypothetical protein ABI592_01155 [Acidobacteriota bacterium]
MLGPLQTVENRSTVSKGPRQSPAEVAAALDALTPGERNQIFAYTIRRLRRGVGKSFTADEIVADAFARLRSGQRTAPRGEPIVDTVCDVVGSMVSSAAKSWTRRNRRNVREVDALLVSAREIDVTLYPRAVREPGEEFGSETLNRVFANDPAAAAVVEGLAAGHSARRIRTEVGLTKSAYATIRRRIRRRVNAWGPEILSELWSSVSSQDRRMPAVATRPRGTAPGGDFLVRD